MSAENNFKKAKTYILTALVVHTVSKYVPLHRTTMYSTVPLIRTRSGLYGNTWKCMKHECSR